MQLYAASSFRPAISRLSSSISAAAVALGLMIFVPGPLGLRAVAQSDPAATNARSSADFMWRQTPRSAISPGKNSLDLNPCPPGVLASEPAYYINLSGSGGQEAVHVTGGTCRGDGKPGTIEFVAGNLTLPAMP